MEEASEHRGARAVCAGCGDRIGVYEPILRGRSGELAVRTSWPAFDDPAEEQIFGPLWHERCGLDAGLRSG